MYGDEIKDIFFRVVPQLIEIAEDHAKIAKQLKTIKYETEKPDHFNDRKLYLLRSLIKEEEMHIRALETDFQDLKDHYQKKYDILQSNVEEPPPPPLPVSRYVRFLTTIEKPLRYFLRGFSVT